MMRSVSSNVDATSNAVNVAMETPDEGKLLKEEEGQKKASTEESERASTQPPQTGESSEDRNITMIEAVDDRNNNQNVSPIPSCILDGTDTNSTPTVIMTRSDSSNADATRNAVNVAMETPNEGKLLKEGEEQKKVSTEEFERASTQPPQTGELSEDRSITMIEAVDDGENQSVSPIPTCMLGGTDTNTIPTVLHRINKQHDGVLVLDPTSPQDKEKTGCIPISQRKCLKVRNDDFLWT
jgi:hypothetical protein